MPPWSLQGEGRTEWEGVGAAVEGSRAAAVMGAGTMEVAAAAAMAVAALAAVAGEAAVAVTAAAVRVAAVAAMAAAMAMAAVAIGSDRRASQRPHTLRVIEAREGRQAACFRPGRVHNNTGAVLCTPTTRLAGIPILCAKVACRVMARAAPMIGGAVRDRVTPCHRR